MCSSFLDLIFTDECQRLLPMDFSGDTFPRSGSRILWREEVVVLILQLHIFPSTAQIGTATIFFRNSKLADRELLPGVDILGRHLLCFTLLQHGGTHSGRCSWKHQIFVSVNFRTTTSVQMSLLYNAICFLVT